MSPSPHQDSPKVPAAAVDAARRATGCMPAMLEVALTAAWPHIFSALLSDVWRCPVHGLVEPLRVTPSYGTGDPDEWGTCPLNLVEEGEVCGERMTPVYIYEQVGGTR